MRLPLLGTERPRALLLIDRELGDSATIHQALDPLDTAVELEQVPTVSAGIERLGSRSFDAVLVELFGPSGGGLQALAVLRSLAPSVPILVLAAPGDEAQARQAVLNGAHAYLLKNHLGTDLLSRALRNVEREALEDAESFERERADVTLNSMGDAVLSTDLAGSVVYLNPTAERLTGWTRADAIGRPASVVLCLVDGIARVVVANPLLTAMEENRAVTLTPNCLLLGKNGEETAIEDSATPIHDRRGRLKGAVIVFRDVTAARTMAMQLSHLAHHDVLTDLPNRVLLNDRLKGALSSAARHGRRLAILYMDVDGFKPINDTFGHAVGDQLLEAMAVRLKGCVRSSDTVCRVGGDEFVVLLLEAANANDVFECATQILSAIAAPYPLASRNLQITVSMGISHYPDHGEDPDSLIQAADTAMYHAKRKGAGRCELFQPSMNVHPTDPHLPDEDRSDPRSTHLETSPTLATQLALRRNTSQRTPRTPRAEDAKGPRGEY